MEYTVEIHYEAYQTEYLSDMSEVEAAAKAKEHSGRDDRKVFVSWFRAADGQRGYLNRDGRHDITGTAW